MTITRVYAGDIVKTSRTDDGDLLVYGKATGPDLDLDKQICDPAWLKSAMPGWAQWSNIREQHTAIAAGVGIETIEDGDDWYVKSLVVDAGSARKVEMGVLKGYSIGIKNARVVKDAAAPGGRIVGGDIVEISLVDRPCNPTATMAIAKSADGDTALAPVDVAGELVMDLSKAVIVDQGGGGTAGKAARDFDRTAALADVAAILDGTRTAVALNKDAAGYDETADIAGALDVIRGIAALICSEAESLGTGRLEEVYDIGCLMDAVRAMAWFLECERAQDSGPGPDDGELMYVALSADTDLAKVLPISDAAALAAAVVTADAIRKHVEAGADTLGLTGELPQRWAPDTRPESNKSATLGADQGDDPDRVTLVKALDASKERIAALEADLAKAKAQPAGGGPATMRVAPATPPAVNKTVPSAEYYKRMADTVSDPQARTGYLQLAKQATVDTEAAK